MAVEQLDPAQRQGQPPAVAEPAGQELGARGRQGHRALLLPVEQSQAETGQLGRMFPGEGVRVTVGERAAEDAVIAAVDALAHNL